MTLSSLGGGLKLPGGGLGLGRPGGLGGSRPVSSGLGHTNAVSSISQRQGVAHIYQSGDKTSLYGAGQHAGQGSSVSIGQVMKKPGSSGLAGRPGMAGGSKPVMPVIK